MTARNLPRLPVASPPTPAASPLTHPADPDFAKEIRGRWRRQMPGKDANAAALFAVANALTKQLERSQTALLKPLGFSLVEYQVIASLYLGASLEEGISPVSLNLQLGQTSAAMTQILNRLQKAVLLERHPNPLDRRSITVRLTAQGRSCAEQLCAAMAGHQKQQLSHLDAAEIKAILEKLQLLLVAVI